MRNNQQPLDKRHAIMRRIDRLDARSRVYAVVFLVLAATAVFFALRDNRRPVTAKGDHDYPIAYSAVSGTDAWLSPSDVELRADSYLAQFREFDRTYCFEYWMQCQTILAGLPGYSPDEERSAEAQEDYDRYIILVRTANEEHRALVEKLVTCSVLAGLAMIPAVLMAVSRLRRVMLRGQLFREEDPALTDDIAENK